MKKLVPIFLIFATFFFIALAAGISYDRARSKAPTTPAHVVNLLGDHADPDLLVIKMGESVQFNSSDNVDHNIGQGLGDNETPQDGSQPTAHAHTDGGIESGLFKPDEGYRLQFKQAGTYDFHDHLHPKIKVKIVVYDPSK